MRRLLVSSAVTAVLATAVACQPIAAEPGPVESLAGTVVAVVDGDTIDVDTSEGERRVRIIGMDAPEIRRDGSASDCYAEESRAFLDELLYQQSVTLETDPSQDAVDGYGRWLRHVLVDGESAAQLAIADGAAIEYTYATAHAQRDGYRAAQDDAREAGIGLWGVCR